MNENDGQLICPWCSTEIVWDTEIGPEEECPHCYNELGSYRSISLTVKQTGSDLLMNDDEEADEDDNRKSSTEAAKAVKDLDFDEDDDGLDEPFDEDIDDDGYTEMVTNCIDEQEEAPECSYCHDLMIFGGVRRMAPGEFTPAVPTALGRSFLPSEMELQVYICPSCFKTESYLADNNRLAMIDSLKGNKGQ